MPLFGMAPNEDVARVITLVALALQAILAIASTRVVAKINSVAVGLELLIVVVLAVALIVAVLITGTGSTDNLISQGIAAHAPQYFGVGGGLMLAMIMGLATLVGFDAAANLAEEAKDPFRTVPRAIVSSVAAAAVLGLVFLVTLTIAIRDVPEVSRSESPVSVIMRDQLGVATERILLVAIVFAFFGAGLVVMTTCSPHRLRDVPRPALPGPPVDAQGRPPHQHPGPGDHPGLRGGRGADAGGARRRAAGTDHRVHDSPGAHLRRDGDPLPGGAQAPGAQGGRVQPGPLRAAGGRSAPWPGRPSCCSSW